MLKNIDQEMHDGDAYLKVFDFWEVIAELEMLINVKLLINFITERS